jgi:hypothetical protein
LEPRILVQSKESILKLEQNLGKKKLELGPKVLLIFKKKKTLVGT